MKNILVFGNFGYKTNQLDGQTIKTRSYFKLLKENYKNGNVYDFCTSLLKSNPLRLIKLIWLLCKSEYFVLFPANGGMATYFPIFYYISKIINKKIILICIGGWQIEFFEGSKKFGGPHNRILKMSKDVYAFAPEVDIVYNKLQKHFDFHNLVKIPNFRFFRPIKLGCNKDTHHLKLVYLGRINKNKGYELMFDVVQSLINKGKKISLDLYGGIENECYEDFMNKINKFDDDIVRYKGSLAPEKIQNTLLNYDLLIFPTRYYTEGLPGTIIDAYISGLPVIATEWLHSHQFVKNDETGYVIPFENPKDCLIERIENLINNPDELLRLKQNALLESEKYSSGVAWDAISKLLKS